MHKQGLPAKTRAWRSRFGAGVLLLIVLSHLTVMSSPVHAGAVHPHGSLSDQHVVIQDHADGAGGNVAAPRKLGTEPDADCGIKWVPPLAGPSVPIPGVATLLHSIYPAPADLLWLGVAYPPFRLPDPGSLQALLQVFRN